MQDQTASVKETTAPILKDEDVSAKVLRRRRNRKLYFDRLKQDPVLYQQYLEKKRAYEKERQRKKRLLLKGEPIDNPENANKAQKRIIEGPERTPSHSYSENDQSTSNTGYPDNDGNDEFTAFVCNNAMDLSVDFNDLSDADILKCKQAFISKKYMERAKSISLFPPPQSLFNDDDGFAMPKGVLDDDGFSSEAVDLPVDEYNGLPLRSKSIIQQMYKQLSSQQEQIDQLTKKLESKITTPERTKSSRDSSYTRRKQAKSEHSSETSRPPKVDDEFHEMVESLKKRDEAVGDDDAQPDPLLLDKIIKFLDKDEISIDSMGGRRKHILHLITLLHQRFLFEEDVECSLSLFKKCIPGHMQRLDPEESAICACPTCMNPDLKLSRFISLGVLKMDVADLEIIILNDQLLGQVFDQLEEFAHSQELITFYAWSKNDSVSNNTKKKVTETLAVLIEKFKEELLVLQSHIQRVVAQYRSARSARNLVAKSDTSALLHFDWTGRAKIYQTHNHSGVIFSEKTVLVHGGTIKSANRSIGIGAFSDSKNMNSVAAWIFIQDALESLVSQGIRTFFIVSSGPVCLYKNKTSFYLMKLFIKQQQDLDIQFRWIYLEPWHGHGPATYVGRQLKTVIEDTTASRPADLVTNANDLMDLVRPEVDFKLLVYSDEDIQELKDKIPILKIIPGSVNFAEVFVSAREFCIKHSSDDKNFTHVSGRMIKYGTTPWNSPVNEECQPKPLPRERTPSDRFSNHGSTFDICGNPAPLDMDVSGDANESFDYEVASPSFIEIVTNE